MIIGILREPSIETRVSLIPEHIKALTKHNIKVIAEHDCGNLAFAPDNLYVEQGVEMAKRDQVLKNSDILLSIHPITNDDIDNIKKGYHIN